MKNVKQTALLLILPAFLAFAGCGGGSDGGKSSSAPPPGTSSAAPAGKSADGVDHAKFEEKYKNMCIQQELALRKQEHPNSGNAGVADATLSDLCTCIAKEESKRVTKQEARKFVEQNEYPFSLMIKAGQAEETCAKK